MSSATPPVLRVALVFGGTIQGEHTLPTPEPVILGYGGEALLPLPEGIVRAPELEVLRPRGDSYELLVHPKMGGAVWNDGQRTEVSRLGAIHPLGPYDYGVVTIGQAAFFFQMVAAPPKLGWVPNPEWSLWAAVALSIFLHAAAGVIFAVARYHDPVVQDDLSLELVRQFMVTPPPEEVAPPEPDDAGGTNAEDPGVLDQDEAGGRAHEEDEGRVGRQDAEQEQTEMEGEVTGGAAAVRVQSLALLGAIRGEDGEENALADALEGPNIGDLLGGLNSARTVMGRGSGGAGLRGEGSGGGGDGQGTLFGAGQLGTGVGAGRGAGAGRGRGGPGARGRERREVRVQMRTATPRVSGYLSAEQIMRVVRRNQGAVRYCYENELQRQPRLAGRIVIRWRVARSGSVSSARVGSSTMNNARVEGCIVRQVRRWRFPQPDGGEVDVDFPFIFGAG